MINQFFPQEMKNPLRLPRCLRYPITTDTLFPTQATDLLSLPTPLAHSHFPSLIPPVPSKKVYCTHFLRTGTCAYLFKGCRYSHDSPSFLELLALGFTDVPKWYTEREMIGKLATLEDNRLTGSNDNGSVSGEMEDRDEVKARGSTSASMNLDDTCSTPPTVSKPSTPTKQRSVGTSPQSSPLPQDTKVLYCLHWLRTGKCDFPLQPGGCRYIHMMPDDETLHILGFANGKPRWWSKKRDSSTTNLFPPNNGGKDCDDIFPANRQKADDGDTATSTTSQTSKTATTTSTANTSTTLSSETIQTKSFTTSPFSTRTKPIKTHCTYFLRSGKCSFSTQGQKCKFSHDLPLINESKEKATKVTVRLPPVMPKIPPNVTTMGHVKQNGPHGEVEIDNGATGSESKTDGEKRTDEKASKKEERRPTTPNPVTATTQNYSTNSVKEPVSNLTYTSPTIPLSPTSTPTTRLTTAPSTPPQSRKKYCTHFLTRGECDFVQQGCRYLHSFPESGTERDGKGKLGE